MIQDTRAPSVALGVQKALRRFTLPLYAHNMQHIFIPSVNAELTHPTTS